MSLPAWELSYAVFPAPVPLQHRGHHPADMMVPGKPGSFHEILTDVVSVIGLL